MLLEVIFLSINESFPLLEVSIIGRFYCIYYYVGTIYNKHAILPGFFVQNPAEKSPGPDSIQNTRISPDFSTKSLGPNTQIQSKFPEFQGFSNYSRLPPQ